MTDSHSLLADVIRGRRTINEFQPQRPPEQLILQAIELATWAPNHKRTEPWKFHLLGPDTVAAIADLNARILTASKGPEVAESRRKAWLAIPGWLFVTANLADDAVRRQEDYAACCCAVQTLMLYLWSEGIGTKWSTNDLFRTPDFQQLLGIEPGSRQLVGMVWFGYAAKVPEVKRKPVEESLVRLP